jgi:hypothetical protein
MLQLRRVPRPLDARPDVGFLLLDVVLQRLLQLVDPVHPLVRGRIGPVELLDDGLQLADFLVVVLPPLLQRLVSRPDLVRHRAIQRGLFDLFVHLELRPELGPEGRALLGLRDLDLPERPLGRLVVALEQLNRLHCLLLAVLPCSSSARWRPAEPIARDLPSNRRFALGGARARYGDRTPVRS